MVITDSTAGPTRARITHELKTWPEFFNETRGGRKRFELRRNDRDFQVGDELLLKEWVPQDIPSSVDPESAPIFKGYTGHELRVRVDYIMDFNSLDRIMDHPGIVFPGYVIMSISLIN